MNGDQYGSVPQYSEHEIDSGITPIVLSVWEPVSPRAVVVFLPATLVHPLFYEPLLRGLAERGIAVVGVHPVGHGRTSRQVKRYTITDIVQNGSDAVSFALDRFDVPVLVMGSNQGGLVAAVLAAEDSRLAGGLAHNILLSQLPQSVSISRYPRWMRRVYRPAVALIRFLAKVLPDIKLPLRFYLDRSRITTDRAIWNAMQRDPLCLSRYSLFFLSSLLSTRFLCLTDGTARTPLCVIADSGDRLFTPAYTEAVYERLRAPEKEIIWFDHDDHMLLVTQASAVAEVLAAKMLQVAESRSQERV